MNKLWGSSLNIVSVGGLNIVTSFNQPRSSLVPLVFSLEVSLVVSLEVHVFLHRNTPRDPAIVPCKETYERVYGVVPDRAEEAGRPASRPSQQVSGLLLTRTLL